MLTARGFWLLMTIVGVLALGVMPNLPVMPLQRSNIFIPHAADVGMVYVALVLLFWFGFSWLLFVIRARLTARRLEVTRRIQGKNGMVATLWSKGAFDVSIGLRLPGRLGIPYVFVRDRVPFAATLEEGDPTGEGGVGGGEAIAVSYRIRAPGAGSLRFEGVNVQMADREGFFYHAMFLAAPVVYRVLPPLADARGRTTIAKRHNLLPPPGIHRLRRPGSGTDLLDLRDYLPGDPPKTIAWKLSARRDRLITKEFESEVPVRCTLFVDVSNSVRIGPPATRPLVQLVELGAIIAQAAAGSRDLTGLCLFDETEATRIRPGRGARHLSRLLNELTRAAALPPTGDLANEETHLNLAYAFAREVYPELIAPDMNRFPFWLGWLAPRIRYAPRRKVSERAFRWMPLLSVAYVLFGLPILFGVMLLVLQALDSIGLPSMVETVVFAMIVLVLVVSFALIPSRSFFPEQRRLYRRRKQLAALLAALYGPSPGALAALLEDGPRFARALQRFLGDHQIPYSLPLYDQRGRYLFTAPAKMDVLTRSLLRAVSGGHDNELFVVLADLLELGDRLDPFLDAVKVALARHHRVMVVCPWPAGIPAPNERGSEPAAVLRPSADLAAALQEADTIRLHAAFFRLRRRLGRVGVPLVCAGSDAPARLILERLEQLRAVGRYR